MRSLALALALSLSLSLSLFVFHRLTVVQVSFCSLIKGITAEIRMLRFVLINSVLLGTADVEQRGRPALYENYPSFSVSSSSIVAVDVTPSHRFDLSDVTCVCSEVRFLSVRSDLSMRLGLQLQAPGLRHPSANHRHN